MKLREFLIIEKGLSSKEVEVAGFVAKGLSNKDVANQLFVTDKTVKFHLTNIFKKLHIKSRAQLIVLCLPNLGNSEPETKEAAKVLPPPPPFNVDTLPTGIQSSRK